MMAPGADGATRTVTAQPAHASAFAAFGALLHPPPAAGERTELDDWLEPVPGRALRCHLNRVAPAAATPRVERVERHPHAAQLFIPVGVTRYLVVVLPADETGAPDPAGARAFVVPGTTAVAYHPGTWHAGISALDEGGSFFVAMWRGGEDDDVFASVPAMDIEVSAPSVVDGAPGRDAGEGKRG